MYCSRSRVFNTDAKFFTEEDKRSTKAAMISTPGSCQLPWLFQGQCSAVQTQAGRGEGPLSSQLCPHSPCTSCPFTPSRAQLLLQHGVRRRAGSF